MDKGKIGKLYEQAHQEWHREYYSSVVDPTIKSVSVTRHFDYELFAELIVQRTLDIIEAHTEIFQGDQARAMVEHIKNSVKTDFGVK
jgi:hypothetical protein